MMLAPRPTALNLGSLAAPSNGQGSTATSPLEGPMPRFPHVRAALSAIAKQYKPTELDDEAGGDDLNRVNTATVSKVVNLLEEEDEDQLQALLKETYAILDDTEAADHVLELMHAQRNDASGVPFLYISPSARRPISRPSSRASSHSVRFPARPETPNSSFAPSSPLGMGFRRPHTPIVSPLGLSQSSSYMNAVSDSPTSSPTLAHAHATQAYAQFAASLPPSPLSSPRLLNAKAHEFKPVPRPVARAASFTNSISSLRAQTPSPDLWAHKASSNLAIAAPLLPESGSTSRAHTPSSGLRSSVRPGEDDDDHDPFDPFSAKPSPLAFPTLDALEFDTAQWSQESNSNSSLSADDEKLRAVDPFDTSDEAQNGGQDEATLLTDGMTPFDVLSSVFGTTLAPSELEEALAANGYDFDRSMAWLIERSLPAPPPKNPIAQQYMGGRVTVVSRGGGRGAVTGRASPRFMNGRAGPGGNRVCRYFLAGECLRADCRFSHDLERALCRFWLRGTCAKGEGCEFLHHLPDVDMSQLSAAMSSASLNGDVSPGRTASPPADDFPMLGSSGVKGLGGNERALASDPSRTRFAAAVKKSAPATPPIPKPTDSATLLARRQAMGPAADPLHHSTAIIAPRPSPRIKLRPPTLLPTLPTGGAVNEMYMAYRARALQLGAARNACLSRAADAWRRGDGAAAKRFSREGHDLNAKMRGEMAESARKLVRDRNKIVEQAVRGRDASWTDDPADRSTRGKICGAGLGVLLGVANKDLSMDLTRLTPEERTECVLDLHGLHANEATEVLEEFLVALEKEHFYGLAYLLVGEEKHTGTQDPGRGASRLRLATAVRETLHHWSYPWSERRDGLICVDPLTHE